MEIYAKWFDEVAGDIHSGRGAWVPYATNDDLCVFKGEMRKRNINLVPRAEAIDRPGISLVRVTEEEK